MQTTCKACNNQGNGMISIFHHPNGVDKMYTFVSGIDEVSKRNASSCWTRTHSSDIVSVLIPLKNPRQIQADDAICIPCYDDLKIAHQFKQKCIQSTLLQKDKTNAARNSGSYAWGQAGGLQEIR